MVRPCKKETGLDFATGGGGRVSQEPQHTPGEDQGQLEKAPHIIKESTVSTLDRMIPLMGACMLSERTDFISSIVSHFNKLSLIINRTLKHFP